MLLHKRLKKASKKDTADFAQRCQENAVGSLDVLAMALAGFGVILLPCLGVLLALGGGIYLLFGAFG